MVPGSSWLERPAPKALADVSHPIKDSDISLDRLIVENGTFGSLFKQYKDRALSCTFLEDLK
jgi:hypothetical protein